MAKTALVISGGGSKGAFAVGILKSIFKVAPNLRFDHIIGTSTGSLIAPFAATGDIATLEKLYTSVSTDDVVTKFDIGNRFLFNNSLFGIKPLANLIAKNYTNEFYEILNKGSASIYLIATCLQTGEATYFTNNSLMASAENKMAYMENGDMFRRAVLASTCQPVLMPPVEIKPGNRPFRQYVDGGVKVYAGIDLAVQLGAEEIFAILLSSEVQPPQRKKYEKVFPILLRTIDLFLDGIGKNDVAIPGQYNQTLKYLEAVQEKMQKAGIPQDQIHDFFNIPENPFSNKNPFLLHILRPETPLGGGLNGMKFDPGAMKAMLTKGESYMNEFIAGLKPGDSVLI